MTDWTLTDVGSYTLAMVDNVPTGISGALPFIANTSLKYCEHYSGQLIGSNAIPEKFQGPILNLTISKVVGLMTVVGADKGFSLGDLSVDGNAGAATELAKTYRELAMEELRRIGGTSRYARTW